MYNLALLLLLLTASPTIMKAQNFNYLQKVVEPLRDLGHKFGSSISIDGNFAVVGAPNSSDIARCYWGAAYIFEKTNNNWVFRQRIVPSDSAMRGGLFGYSVCIKGDQIIVGDPQKDLNFYSLQIGPGAAYIFQRQTNGYWIEVRRLVSPNPTNGQMFGDAVSIDEDFAVVGEPIVNWGAAHVFTRTNNNWSNIPNLQTLQGDRIDGAFGTAVDIDEHKLIVGQTHDDFGITFPLHAYIGSAFIFRYDITNGQNGYKSILPF